MEHLQYVILRSKRVTTLLASGNFFLIELLQIVSQENHIGLDPGYSYYMEEQCSSPCSLDLLNFI